MTIKPIETRYAGHRFRSRLEARWAVFFNHLGIKWEYEPQGYIVDGHPYLPDFLLYPNTDLAFWFEVKGSMPTEEELVKAQGLATGTGRRVIVYFRPPEPPARDLTGVVTAENEFDGASSALWDDEQGWLPMEHEPFWWQFGLRPTAFSLTRPLKGRTPRRRSGCWWWTDCPHCGRVIVKLYGQAGYCPTFDSLPEDASPPELYPSFAYRTPRLLAAYEAAMSARFEHGEAP